THTVPVPDTQCRRDHTADSLNQESRFQGIDQSEYGRIDYHSCRSHHDGAEWLWCLDAGGADIAFCLLPVTVPLALLAMDPSPHFQSEDSPFILRTQQQTAAYIADQCGL